jgi:chromosome partitioning protein
MHSDLPNDDQEEAQAPNNDASEAIPLDRGELTAEEWTELERATDPNNDFDLIDESHGSGWVEVAKKAETLAEATVSSVIVDESAPALVDEAANAADQPEVFSEPDVGELLVELSSDGRPDGGIDQAMPTKDEIEPANDKPGEPNKPVEADRVGDSDRKISMALPRVIAVANQKGGVGKTTTTVNIAACLAEQGYRTLLVDLDPQANASTGLGLEPRELESSVYHVMLHDAEVDSCIEPTEVKNLFVLPSSLDLAGAEIELVPLLSREHRLRLAIKSVIDDYDYVLIDCPPSLGLLTINALTAAHEVLVPIQCEYYALEGLGQLMRNVDLIRSSLNPDLQISHIVLVMFDPRTKLSGQVVDEVRSHFGSTVCDNVIPRTVRLSEAPSFGQPITTFDSDSRGAAAYRAVTQEVLNGQS